MILFWPWAAITGRYLFHRQAVALFCAAGFLASAGLLLGLRRRYFAETGGGILAACLLALGLASGLPLLMARSDVYEVAIGCGYMLVMVGLAALGRSIAESGGRRAAWLAGVSLAAGLAVGARPSLLPGVLILLLPPFALTAASMSPGPWRPQVFRLACAGLLPLTCCGAALAGYNYARFGQILEFGQHYQLTGQISQDGSQHFSLGYLWFNLRVYLFEPVRWSRHFPFAGGIAVPPLPSGHRPVEDPYGILANVPVVALALAAPLARRGRPGTERAALKWLVFALAWLAGSSLLLLGLLDGSCSRYEVDFLPELILLAVLGILGLERALAGRRALRRLVRGLWGILLAGSISFNLLAATEHGAEARCDSGLVLMQVGRLPEAVQAYREALSLKPDFLDAHDDLGIALSRLGQWPGAIGEYEAALRLSPGDVPARLNLGNALAQSGRFPEAVVQYQRTLALDPTNADAHYNLAHVLDVLGRTAEARAEAAEAARLGDRH